MNALIWQSPDRTLDNSFFLNDGLIRLYYLLQFKLRLKEVPLSGSYPPR